MVTAGGEGAGDVTVTTEPTSGSSVQAHHRLLHTAGWGGCGIMQDMVSICVTHTERDKSMKSRAKWAIWSPYLPVKMPPQLFIEWDRILARYLWQGQRARMKFKILKYEKGVMGISCLQNTIMQPS